MDIIPVRKSRLLYQRGDVRTIGVVDLRQILLSKNKQASSPAGKRSVAGIVKAEKTKITFQKAKNWSDYVLEAKKSASFPKPEKISSLKDCAKKRTSEKNNEEPDIEKKNLAITAVLRPRFSFAGNIFFFLFSSVIITSLVFGMSSLQKEIEKKNMVMADGIKALEYLKTAGNSISDSNLEDTAKNLSMANLYFSNTKDTINELGMGISGVLNSLPINTPLSTAENIALAGKNVSLAGKETAGLLNDISMIDKDDFSIDRIYPLQKYIENISRYLESARNNLNNIDSNYVPDSYKDKLSMLNEKLPMLANNFKNFDQDMPIILKMLGSENRQQKYLFIFENNTEIRAGGGFIGSYAIADIESGQMKNLFIDGIFNPDGQLKEKIVPPMPIQKISAAWSMHDANWFPDFPLSAKKVALFYEKTGGATVDGVIAITPNVIENMLTVSGPIEMPEYGIVIDNDNFLKMTQLQVEELYDKEKNNPKQFLSDLAPKIIEKLLDTENLSTQDKIARYLKVAEMIEKSLKEKHIIIYHRDPEIENMILKRGWGGQIQNSSGDYLSVVNSNINGYKTDAVIDETIDLQTEILADGSIIDTVKITRVHNGGDNDYDWYNRVNADYMRVYVPLGSTLIEAKGHTLEAYEPPIDYSGFRTDEDVERIQKTIKIDVDSKTQIFEESGKTVFGNWVYVSPKEKVEVTYKYKLPYKINFDDFSKPAEKYSILVQKQLGSRGSKFTSSINIPINWKTAWLSENLQKTRENKTSMNTDLVQDRVYGIVFVREPEGD